MFTPYFFFSGAMVVLLAAKRSPIPIWEAKGNPWVHFLIFIMASGNAHGRVRTRTTESRNMAAIIKKRLDRDKQPNFTVYVSDIGHP